LTDPAVVRKRLIHRRVTLGLQAILAIGFALSVVQGNWLNCVLIAGIILLTLFPILLKRRLDVFIPPEFELAAILFIFMTLFLGEIHGYYFRFAWWDKLLHTGSGFLLGILGFLLVYVLNEDENVDLNMNPRFVALFSLAFSVSIGAFWEIFEFAMDVTFKLNMQKTGLVDTMWDLIVDTAGASAVAAMGYAYLRGKKGSFLESWMGSFIESNPRLFRRGDR